jgi:hypothetical protein
MLRHIPGRISNAVPHTDSFRGMTQQLVDLNHLDVNPRENVETALYSAATEDGRDALRTLHQRICHACQIIRNCLGTFESARKSMLRRVHVRTGSDAGHLGVCCES